MFIDILVSLALAQHPAMPPGMTHEEHLAQMERDADINRRGEQAMGFVQDAATHHFVLEPTGGVIEVTAKDSADAATRDAIRAHLRTIAEEFGRGVFDKPFATHGELPDGVADMQRMHASIAYRYEALARGGRVVIVAADPEAQKAVHRFLRYQIHAHRTGDPG